MSRLMTDGEKVKTGESLQLGDADVNDVGMVVGVSVTGCVKYRTPAQYGDYREHTLHVSDLVRHPESGELMVV